MNTNNYSNEQMGREKKKLSAAVITIIICVVLAVAAVIYAVISPSGGTPFSPEQINRGTTHYSDMEYTRPDTDQLIADINDLMEMIQKGKSFTEQGHVFTKINTELVTFRTMTTLANIRYASDTTNEDYRTEYTTLEKLSVTISTLTEKLLDVIEDSNYKINYERSYFGVGFFSHRKSYDYTDEVKALLDKETELESRYVDTLSNASVTWDGKSIRMYSEEFYALRTDVQKLLYRQYCTEYSKTIGEIYVSLVKTRLEIAQALKVNYIEYAYENIAHDYTPEQAQLYMENIKKYVIPLYSDISFDTKPFYQAADTMSSFYAMADSMRTMSGTVAEAFSYMVRYGLYNFSYSQKKQGISFTTYLDKYASPYIFISPSGTCADFRTFTHEFGHFIDYYSNLNTGITIDNSEIASQAMAYIAPYYCHSINGLSSEEYSKFNMMQTLETYISTGFTNALEAKIYSLSPAEVTLDKLTEIINACAEEYAPTDKIRTALVTQWFETQHIFLYPFYTVSYSISNDVSLQVLQKELDNPSVGGVKAFMKIIKRSDNSTFEKSITSAGFESPFSEGRAEKIAALIQSVFAAKVEIEPENTVATKVLKAA